MKNKVTSLMILVLLVLTSCVSKKKFVALEQQLQTTKGNLQKTTLEKEKLENKFSAIEKRVTNYNNKINSLKDVNSSLKSKNDTKLDVIGKTAVISNKAKAKMLKTLEKVDPAVLANAKDLKDSMNIAVSYTINKNIQAINLDENDDINVNIDQTVVMISISDKMLFNSGSARVSRKANKVLRKLADIINSEPSMDVMIEGHTDNQSINSECIIDNWDLSVKRATAIVRVLDKKYHVDPSRLIASGRGSSVPLVKNNSRANRSRNRRTKIVILPNLDKFFGLLAKDEKIKL